MEKLTRLKVSGFRSIRELDLDVKDLTVLIGANGSGKSNLVSVFNLLSFMMTGRLQLYLGRMGGASSVLHYGARRTPTLTMELRFESETGWSEYACTLANAAPDRLIFTHERVAFQRTGEPKPYEKQLGSGHIESALAEAALSDGAAKVAKIFLARLKDLRVYHFHDTSQDARIRTNQEVEKNWMLLSNGGNLASFLYMLSESHPKHYSRIVSTVRLVVPFFREFELEPSRLNPKYIQLRWRDRNPDYEFGPHQVSDGSLRAIALVTALLQPKEFLPAVIFVDEPELGLHPSAIGIVARLLKAASTERQVVVATQSPRLLAECAPQDVVVVERNEDSSGFGSSVFRRLDKDELESWLDDYDLGTLYEMNVTGGGPQ